MSKITSKTAALALEAVRAKRPLVHHITNYVTVNDCANIVLAIGASPLMADALSEAEDIVAIASALVLNIGTLNERTVESMLAAGKKANALGIPVVFDPVGAGASPFRNRVTEDIVKNIRLSVLRGNMSEIRFVAGLSATGKGVDASDSDMARGLDEGIDMATGLAKNLKAVVAVTGAIDIVSDGQRTVTLENGHKRLSDITGTGCMATALIGAFLGANEDPLLAASAALLSMGIAGELAYEEAGMMGTGSYRVALIDAISLLNGKTLAGRARINEV